MNCAAAFLTRATRSGSEDAEDRFPHLSKIAKDVPRTFGGIQADDAAWASASKRESSSSSLNLSALTLGGAAEQWAKTYLRWGVAAPPEAHGDGDRRRRPRRSQRKGRDDDAAPRRRDFRRLARVLNVGSELFGYAQGMNFVAGTLLTECEAAGRGEGLAFGLYAYLLRQLHVERLYGRSLATSPAAFEKGDSTWVFPKQRPREKHPRFGFAPGDARSSKSEPNRVGNDRDTRF